MTKKELEDSIKVSLKVSDGALTAAKDNLRKTNIQVETLGILTGFLLFTSTVTAWGLWLSGSL